MVKIKQDSGRIGKALSQPLPKSLHMSKEQVTQQTPTHSVCYIFLKLSTVGKVLPLKCVSLTFKELNPFSS